METNTDSWVGTLLTIVRSPQFKTFLSVYGPSFGLFLLSILAWLYLNGLLRRTVCEVLASAQGLVKKNELYRVVNKVAFFVPVIGFHFAVRRLLTADDLIQWLDNGFLVVCQVLFILILLNIIGPALESWSSDYVNMLGKIRKQFTVSAREQFLRRSRMTFYTLRILLFLLPVVTLFSVVPASTYVLWTVPFFVVIILVSVCFSMESTAKRQLARIEERNRKQGSFTLPEMNVPPDDPDFLDRASIARLFLEIYRHQLGVPEQNPAYFKQIEHHISRAYHTYELSVKVKRNWQSRRMSIGRLGESASSRCKCYLAIYDEYIVIKVPEKKTEHLKDYIQSIRKEHRVVERIGLKECIIPKISVILKHIPGIPKFSGGSEEEEENSYIRVLLHSSDLHKYLKIRDQFVFFMDMSKYYFMEQAVFSMHAVDALVKKEIRRQADIAWDMLEFEYRYGRNIVQLMGVIRKMYNRVEAEYRQELGALESADHENSPYQFKQWFFAKLAGDVDAEGGEGGSREIYRRLSRTMETLMQEQDTIIAVYRQSIKETVYEAEFQKNKSSVEGIIKNLLALLIHLEQKNVAMRDIKPDNLLLAGDKNHYPGFLATPDQYVIGLIDVETAVVADDSDGRKVKQPLLGGTPQYATPSHFFTNDIIEQVFASLPRILMLQDWYAVIGIIFKVITGRFLFEQTAQLIPYIIKSINQTINDKKDLAQTFIKVSDEFWNHAAMEFDKKLDEDRGLLRQTMVTFPDRGEFMRKEYNSHPEMYEKHGELKHLIDRLFVPGEPVLDALALLKIMFAIVCYHMTDIRLRQIPG